MVPSLELNLIGVGYVSYIQVVYTSLNLEKLGHFLLLTNICECIQFILSLGGEGCSGSAHLAVLTLTSIR